MQCWPAHPLHPLLLLAAVSACVLLCCLPVARLVCLTLTGRGGCGRVLPALLPAQGLAGHWISAGCHSPGE
jgi:hypothetical protein